jgi:hypothetical protein
MATVRNMERYIDDTYRIQNLYVVVFVIIE